jgi:uncharacterized protein
MRVENLPTLLSQLRQELYNLLGTQLISIYLYGSQARGDARSDSDIDVLVVLKRDFDYFEMIERTGKIAAELSLEYDTVVSLAFTTKIKFDKMKSPFLLNIRQEGVLV